MATEQQTINNVINRMSKVGAQNTVLCLEEEIIDIENALLGYRDELADAVDHDIRFHTCPIDELSLIGNKDTYLSINPIEFGLMTTTEFPTDDIGVIRTINMRSMFKNSRSQIRMQNLLELLINAIGELDAI
jgi:hypothetical protein